MTTPISFGLNSVDGQIQCATITIVNDNYESNHPFAATIASTTPTLAINLASTIVTPTIIDNDGKLF